MEYTLWCDESVGKGEFYSDFFGGALVASKDITIVKQTLADKKLELNLHGEVKWTKTSVAYLEKYKQLMDCFFYLVGEHKIKVRVMFTQNCHVPVGLTKEQKENHFFLLYYQFLKHSFGFLKTDQPEQSNVRFYFDRLPDTKAKCDNFKQYVHGLRHVFTAHNLTIKMEDITEIVSHDHDVLQCLDVVMGAMAFRLNNRHKCIPEGKTRRGKKTVAKEKLYKHIYQHVNALMSRQFNPGDSTGQHEGPESCWTMPYRHWKLIPRNRTYDSSKTK